MSEELMQKSSQKQIIQGNVGGGGVFVLRMPIPLPTQSRARRAPWRPAGGRSTEQSSQDSSGWQPPCPAPWRPAQPGSPALAPRVRPQSSGAGCPPGGSSAGCMASCT